jgi:hypothetical protein
VEPRPARLTFHQGDGLRRMAHHLDPGDLDELLGSVAAKLRSGPIAHLDTPVGQFRAAAVHAWEAKAR